MDIDFEDISNAPMIALNTRATSGEAKKLVSTISHLLQKIVQMVLLAECELVIFKHNEDVSGITSLYGQKMGRRSGPEFREEQ